LEDEVEGEEESESNAPSIVEAVVYEWITIIIN
jgi:hypothetical protein